MLCFLSKEKDSSCNVVNNEISFVHVPDDVSKEEIKILVSKKAKLFADTLNLNTVYLHCGKDLITYEYEI